jgi:hypothetical protein
MKPSGLSTPFFLLKHLIKGEQCREFSAGDCRYVTIHKPCLIPK